MSLARMKVALGSSRNVVQSLTSRVVEGERDQVGKVAGDEKSNFTRCEPVVPHSAFVRKVVDDVSCRATRLCGDVLHNFALQSCEACLLLCSVSSHLAHNIHRFQRISNLDGVSVGAHVSVDFQNIVPLH